MRWEDERYVRLYLRDTADWLALPFEAQAILPLVMRKLDRSGRMPLGRHGLLAVAICIGHRDRFEFVKAGMDALIADETFVIEDGNVLFMPNYRKAQEAVSSGAKRSKDWRERQRDESSPDSDETLPNATAGDGPQRTVTPSQPSGAVPCLAVPPKPARKRASGRWADLGPIGSEVVTAVNAGLEKTLVPLRSQSEADEFEARLGAFFGSADVAISYIAKTSRSREMQPTAVALLLIWLQDLGPIPEATRDTG